MKWLTFSIESSDDFKTFNEISSNLIEILNTKLNTSNDNDNLIEIDLNSDFKIYELKSNRIENNRELTNTDWKKLTNNDHLFSYNSYWLRYSSIQKAAIQQKIYEISNNNEDADEDKKTNVFFNKSISHFRNAFKMELSGIFIDNSGVSIMDDFEKIFEISGHPLNLLNSCKFTLLPTRHLISSINRSKNDPDGFMHFTSHDNNKNFILGNFGHIINQHNESGRRSDDEVGQITISHENILNTGLQDFFTKRNNARDDKTGSRGLLPIENKLMVLAVIIIIIIIAINIPHSNFLSKIHDLLPLFASGLNQIHNFTEQIHTTSDFYRNFTGYPAILGEISSNHLSGLINTINFYTKNNTLLLFAFNIHSGKDSANSRNNILTNHIKITGISNNDYQVFTIKNTLSMLINAVFNSDNLPNHLRALINFINNIDIFCTSINMDTITKISLIDEHTYRELNTLNSHNNLFHGANLFHAGWSRGGAFINNSINNSLNDLDISFIKNDKDLLLYAFKQNNLNGERNLEEIDVEYSLLKNNDPDNPDTTSALHRVAVNISNKLTNDFAGTLDDIKKIINGLYIFYRAINMMKKINDSQLDSEKRDNLYHEIQYMIINF